MSCYDVARKYMKGTGIEDGFGCRIITVIAKEKDGFGCCLITDKKDDGKDALMMDFREHLANVENQFVD